MSLLLVGLNHKTAPVALLEKLSIAEADLDKALHQLTSYEHVLEGVILSTCNRVEVYADVSRFHAGSLDLRNLLAEFRHLAPEDFVDHLYTYHEDAALRHLFRVASGIDSMVIGESEILGQVRRAYHAAADVGVAGRSLGAAFRQALRVGKRARTETAIGRNPVSISSAAVELARRAFAGRTLAGKSVLIVGAGKMGRLAASALARTGATNVTLVNRTEERALLAAREFSARARPWEELDDAFAEADIVITSTTASEIVIERDLVRESVARRAKEDPLFIVDIAVPRDVESSVATLDNVVLHDVDDLRGVVKESFGSRQGEVTKVERIVESELTRFFEWHDAHEFAPTASALVAKAESIRRAELDELGARLERLSPEDRAAIDRLTARITAKLMHDPLNNAARIVNTEKGRLYIGALRELFELDDEPYP